MDALHESDVIVTSHDAPGEVGHIQDRERRKKLQVTEPEGCKPGLELAEVL
jgi:hypothetical protein